MEATPQVCREETKKKERDNDDSEKDESDQFKTANAADMDVGVGEMGGSSTGRGLMEGKEDCWDNSQWSTVDRRCHGSSIENMEKRELIYVENVEGCFWVKEKILDNTLIQLINKNIINWRGLFKFSFAGKREQDQTYIGFNCLLGCRCSNNSIYKY